MGRKKTAFIALLIASVSTYSIGGSLSAQEADEVEEDLRYTPQRLINLPTGHNLAKKELNVVILHRFLANLRDTAEDSTKGVPETLWGLDEGAYMSFELSYGLADWFSFGFHRTTNDKAKVMEAFIRLTLLKEFGSDGWSLKRKNWFSLALQAGAAQATTPDAYDSAAGNYHLILAKRLIPQIHVYAVPALTTAAHYDRLGAQGEENISTIGYGIYLAPFLNSSFRIVAEHFPGIRRYTDYYDTWGAGMHLSTGTHTFSIFVTNSVGTTLDLYSQSSKERELHLGFNLVRRFNFAKE